MPCVSIHAPAWGATVDVLEKLNAEPSFNPRPRMGGDEFPRYEWCVRYVSIHAPAWGATQNRTDTEQFQSTPPHGGRQDQPPLARQRLGFNPRPRMGGDKMAEGRLTQLARFNPRPRMGGDITTTSLLHRTQVSIHAPAWGATVSFSDGNIGYLFQSTPPHGGRLPGREEVEAGAQFQSTPPHGGRRT